MVALFLCAAVAAHCSRALSRSRAACSRAARRWLRGVQRFREIHRRGLLAGELRSGGVRGLLIGRGVGVGLGQRFTAGAFDERLGAGLRLRHLRLCGRPFLFGDRMRARALLFDQRLRRLALVLDLVLGGKTFTLDERLRGGPFLFDAGARRVPFLSRSRRARLRAPG